MSVTYTSQSMKLWWWLKKRVSLVCTVEGKSSLTISRKQGEAGSAVKTSRRKATLSNKATVPTQEDANLSVLLKRVP